RHAVDPGGGPGVAQPAVGPAGGVHHVVAVPQGGEAASPDEAVVRGDRPDDPCGAATPGDGAAPAIPVEAPDWESTIGQGGDQIAHEIPGVGTDQAVVGRGGAADAGGGTPPGDRAAAAVPALDHVVPVGKNGDAVAHAIESGGANQAVIHGDGAA